jgi:serine/threonine protein kinase
MQHDPLAFGAVLNGELSVEEKLGRQVYRARRTQDGRELAVRVVRAQTQAQATELLTRAEAVSGIRHPALARVEGHGSIDDRTYYIASELVRGSSLMEWVHAFGAPSLPQILALIQSLCAALQAALAIGIVHEALHPGSVRVLRSRADLTIKLLDLGVPALWLDGPPDAIALRFMAPEQLAALDHRSSAATNVYACGALLYFLALGESPYACDDLEALVAAQAEGRFKPPISLQPRFPSDLNDVVVRALALDPDQRYPSVSELAEALAACSGSVSQYVQSLGPRPTPSLASPERGRVSGTGVEPIGLLSSSPPVSESLLPEAAIDRDTDISSLREHYDIAAKSGTSETTKPKTQRWLVVPAIASALLIGIVLLRSASTPEPNQQQGAVASRARETPAPPPGLPLTAQVQIHEVQVQGSSLPTALIKRAVIRLRSHFKTCYERAAQAAGHNSFDELMVNVQIDARGRAHSPSVQGSKLPELETCIAAGASKLISEGPSDTHSLVASWKLSFRP